MDGYPGNGIYVVQGEISALITSMKKVHWSARSYLEDENNPLMKSLNELKMILNQITDLREIELITFLEPFLDIIHSSETTVQVTALALSSINKFITYGLIGGISEKELLPIVENIAETVSHANFVTTDYPSDAVILMKIVEVLRTLVMSPLGILLSNDSICEIMLSCFRICFEVRLNELLRQNAEHCLKDIVQMLFLRLPLFTQSSMADGSNYKKMRIRSKTVESNQKKKKSIASDRNLSANISAQPIREPCSQVTECSAIKTNDEEISKLPSISVTSKSDSISEEDGTGQSNLNSAALSNVTDDKTVDETNSDVKVLDSASRNDTENNSDVSIPIELAVNATHEENIPCNAEAKIIHHPENCDISPSDMGIIIDSTTDEVKIDCADSAENLEKVPITIIPSTPIVHYEQSSSNFHSANQQIIDGQIKNSQNGEQIALEPHNSVCVQELLRFLSLICNPHDKQNTEIMIHVSLSLLVIALEVGANSISKHPALLTIIKDTLCRNLLSLLQTEKMQIFTMNLHVSFLIFESMRSYLKFQLEFYLTRLSDIIVLDASKISYEKKEMALESLVQLWKIPGFVTELFLNYDCDLYCPNLYEEITKLLSKNVYPVAGIYSTHLLSLDALLTIVESIEKHCHSRISNEKTTIDSSHSLDEGIKGDNNTVSSPSTKDTSNKNEEGTVYNVPTHEQLMALKRKKKLLSTGTEHFNSQPKKGIQFLQEQGLLSTPLEPSEVANFLRENPHLDKKMIGEFISHRNSLQVLESFVKSFDFTDMRIDEALRVYLETFRLPGESPLISLVMQQFADHWHKCNNEPFTKSDAAFVLAYAVIMLNVDQHNQIVRRQHTPMTVDDFKKNLKGVDAGKDFDQDFLNEIYQSIKNEEIVMPAEHTGLVRENYLWKVLLRRGASKDGKYILAYDGLYDHELFSICWGPVVTALGYVFDKATDSSIYYKSIQGFRKCATISAHYGMSNEFDFLTLSLCKFTALLSSFDNADSFVVSFGMNSKARLAARTVFSLVHRYGDILREGWRPIFDCIFQLFRCKLLPKILVEAEDFLELSGKVSIVRDDPSSHKTIESGILSSLYSYITLATDASSPRFTTDEEQECTEIAKTCITDCHLENLILESKFLRLESLHELLKVLIRACYNSEDKISISNKREEDKAIFFLELLLKVVIQNRDRVNSLWPIVCEHMNVLLLTAANCNQQFLLERCVIGYLRLAIRLMRKEEISSFVLQSLNTLLLLKWSSLSPVCRQIAYGLHELLKTSAANIHTAVDWSVIFTLLEVVGAGAPLKSQLAQSTEFVSSEEANTEGAAEDSGLGDKFSGSDSSINHLVSSNISSPSISSLHLESKDTDNNSPMFYLSEELMPHDPFALVKCCESLAFLVRDVAHITPFNFENCVHCIRTFVEATFYSEEKRNAKRKSSSKIKQSRKVVSKKTKSYSPKRHSNNPYDADESDPEEYPDSYYQIPLQLLDLMHTLHTRTAQIYRWWAEEESSEADMSVLWPRGWCPLLQGISRFCCDPRKPVRMSAITYLQRALLMHDLQTLTAEEWSSCFSNVLFPLMEKLLEPLNENDHAGMEETRMRAATLLLKVFLHHLTPLQTLQSFSELWLRILDFMDRYMNIDKHSDLLNEAIQESVKNMLLVMDSANLFTDENKEKHLSFWDVTWERINKFLPNLKDELYRHHSPIHELNEQVAEELPNLQMASMKIINGQNTDLPRNEPETTARQHSISELTKNSVPIFPHMGQLISTPIGPPMVTKEFVGDNNFQNGNLREVTINEDRNVRHENIETNESNIPNIPYNAVITTEGYYYPEVCTPTAQLDETVQLTGGHTEFSSLITTSSDFLPTLPAIRPHSFVPFSTEPVSQYQPTIPSNPSTFPVYSGFLQLGNSSGSSFSVGQQGDASQFFYQNLNEYHNTPLSYPEVASQNFIGNTDAMDPAISNSALNTKLSEEP